MRNLIFLISVLIFSYSTPAKAQTGEEVVAKLSEELNIKFIEQRKFEFKGEKIINAYESITYFIYARKNEPVLLSMVVFRGYNKKNFQTFAGYYGTLVQALLPNWNPKKSETYEEMRGKHSYLSLYDVGATAFLIEETSSTGNLNIKVDLNMQNKFAQAELKPK